MKTFNLEVSKRFKELGIEVEGLIESEYYYHYTRGRGNDKVVHKSKVIWDSKFSDYYPLCTIQDLPYLLEELGKVKGWDQPIWRCGQYRLLGKGRCEDEYCSYAGWKDTRDIWAAICELYYKHRELGEGSECEKYLLDLMK